MNDCLVNFKVSTEERQAFKDAAKEKGFKNLSTFLRFVVRKFYKDVEFNKDGLFNG